MKTITFLLGAGASCQSLPITHEIPERLMKFKNIVLKEENKLPNQPFDNIDLKEMQDELQLMFIDDLEWLITESSSHASIDTLAKKLYLKEDYDSLNKLKHVFAAFLTVEQFTNGFDSRYDTFLASILKNDIYGFPDNIRIVSWNYDFQLALAFDQYSNRGVPSNLKSLRTISKHDDISGNNYEKNTFSNVKLNGVCWMLKNGGFDKYFYYRNKDSFEEYNLVKNAIRNYSASMKLPGIYSGISFAWEDDIGKSSIVDKANQVVEETDVLVVIGYSFPFFNRMIDRQVIGSMNKLTKVYFQDISPENIKQSFKSIRQDIDDVNLIGVSNLTQFYIPNEM